MQQETRNCTRNRQIVMAPIGSRSDQSDCDAYPHLEAVAVSKQIELEVWGLAQPLHLSEFFQNVPYLVDLYATGDLQSHPKSPNCESVNTIESRPDQSDCDAYPHLEAVAVSKRIELKV
jgi:hypothetical protein